MEFLLGDFNAKLGRGDICKPTRGMDDNDHDARVINFSTSKNLFVKSKMFTHRKIHKHTRTSPDKKIHNKNDHIMTGYDLRGSSMYHPSRQLTVVLITVW
jgi:hypothetical protein